MTRSGRFIHRFRLLFYVAALGAAIVILIGFGFFSKLLRTSREYRIRSAELSKHPQPYFMLPPENGCCLLVDGILYR